MDSIKAAAKAIRNSPKMIRKKMAHDHMDHHKLDDDWLHSQDPVESGVSFYVKYLGTAEVEKTHGPGSTNEAVKEIIHHAKTKSGGLQKVQLTISAKSVITKDVLKDTVIREEPLYKVSYCTVDPNNTSIFCYISRNRQTGVLECFAFLSSNRSKAEAITLTVAQAFNIAYEKWQKKKQKKQMESLLATSMSKSKSTDYINVGVTIDKPTSPKAAAVQPDIPTIQTSLAETPKENSSSNPFLNGGMMPHNLHVKQSMTKAKSMDQIQPKGSPPVNELDMEFTLLAEARSHPNLMDTGDVKEGQLSADVTDFLSGDNFPASHAFGASVDDLLRL
ncbi:low density lipoprotein receptor adapter protein 1-like [Dysidea avara]|uniref:low density lipoprotein receptor adapter protein 1-like n=1 Tax=Dysidea avara TaxID=196820 RepID=UPI0033195B1B